MSDEEINDEELFWKKLIEWWRANKDSPVPERMYLALRLAGTVCDDRKEEPTPGSVRH